MGIIWYSRGISPPVTMTSYFASAHTIGQYMIHVL